ncbi:MAG TPA: DinB family protein [Candidatus Binatia bacterium]|nr:DinB family protein [Candidatus Binatia bacterium]
MEHDRQLRQQLAKAIDWHEAHADFSAAVADFPAKLRGRVPEGLPYSAWQLLEHIRIALWDIVEFCRDARHKSPPWPEDYWPKKAAPPSEEAWEQSVHAIRDNLEAMRKLISDANHDLFKPLPHGSGQTLFREALLVADHNAYHLGQLVLVRKALGVWKA